MMINNGVMPCALLISLIILVSIIKVTLPSEKVIVDQNAASLVWLIVTIVSSIPPLVTSLIDLQQLFSFQFGKANFSNLLIRKIFHLLGIIVIFAPNCTIYLTTDSPFNISGSITFTQIQSEFFFTQSLLMAGCILCSILDYCRTSDSIVPESESIEKCTITFFTAVASFKLLLLLSSLISNNSGIIICFIASSVFLVFGITSFAFIWFRLVYFLSGQMKGFKFLQYSQMHDFYGINGAFALTTYSFGMFINANSLSSENEGNSNSVIHYLVGQALFLIYLNIVDQQCLSYEAAMKDDQIRTRLDLIRYISHEMKSPLNTAFLGLQILRGNINSALESIKVSRAHIRKIKTVEGLEAMRSIAKVLENLDEVKETAELVNESSSIGLETLNDMLTFDKIDEKKLILEKEDLNIWTFVTETVRPFRINAMNEQITLTTECIHLESNWFEQYCIKADKLKLKQVLRNFVSNAIKFCDKWQGEVQILVEKRPSMSRNTRVLENELESEAVLDLTNEVVRVSVTDNGSGLSLEDQKLIFSEQFPIYNSALQLGQGSCLGLWICKSILFKNSRYFDIIIT